MIQPKPSVTWLSELLGRRWVGLGYSSFALALLLLAALQITNIVEQAQVAAFLIVLVVVAPLTGVLLTKGRSARGRPLALALLIVDALAALGLIAVTGGTASPMWVALLLVSTATPLLLRN